MYPTFATPVTSPTNSTMGKDEATSGVGHRRHLARARVDSSKPHHRVRAVVASVGLAAVVTLGLATTGSLPISQHDETMAVRYP